MSVPSASTDQSTGVFKAAPHESDPLALARPPETILSAGRLRIGQMQSFPLGERGRAGPPALRPAEPDLKRCGRRRNTLPARADDAW